MNKILLAAALLIPFCHGTVFSESTPGENEMFSSPDIISGIQPGKETVQPIQGKRQSVFQEKSQMFC